MLAEVLPLADPLTALLDVEADSPVGDEASPVVGVDSPVSVLPVLAESFELGVAVSVFPLVSAATIVPVLYLGLAGHSSLAALLVGGFFLGTGGTAFAVGVPFVSAWFPPERRGLAIGVFGAGMGGTAISALTTVNLVKAHGTAAPFVITAAALGAYAVIAALLLRDAPERSVPAGGLAGRLAATSRLRVTWQAAALYAVAFGGYVAFSVYLPTYLKNGYGLAQADASNRMAGFAAELGTFGLRGSADQAEPRSRVAQAFACFRPGGMFDQVRSLGALAVAEQVCASLVGDDRSVLE